MTVGIMEVNLVDAHGLKKSDFLNKIDPYVLIQYRSQEHKSTIKRGQGSNPTWNEKFTFRVEYPGADKQPKLVLKLMDHDTFSSDDNIGQATIYLKEVLERGVENGTAELHPQKCRVVDSNQNYCGDIRVGITFTPRVETETYAQDFGGWKENVSFARFLQGGFNNATFRPDTTEEVIPIDDLDFAAELVVPEDPKDKGKEAGTSTKANEVEGGKGPTLSEKRKVDDSGSLKARQMRRKIAMAAASKEVPGTQYKLKDDESQALENQGFAPGRDKSIGALRKVPGHTPELEKTTLSLSLEDTESVTGGFPLRKSHFTDSPAQSSDYPFPNVQGPFVPHFTKVVYVSKLDSEEEREDFVMNSTIPARKQELEIMINGAFHDYSNEALIRMMAVQVEHLHRFKLMDEDRDRLLRENNKLVKKLKRMEAQGESEQVEQLRHDLDLAKGDALIWQKEKESVESELKLVKDQMLEVNAEKGGWQKRCEEAEAKVERFAMDDAEYSEREKSLRTKNESLELSVQQLSEKLERNKEDWKVLVGGYPKVARKFLKSFEFAKEMGGVQSKAVVLGRHRNLEKVKTRIPKLDITKFEDYNPQALLELTAAGEQLEDKDYPYLVRLASSFDLSAEEILAIDPDPFLEELA